MVLFADGENDTLRMVFGAAASIISALAVAVVYLWRTALAEARKREEELIKQRDELLRICLANGLRSQIPESVPRSALGGDSNVTW